MRIPLPLLATCLSLAAIAAQAQVEEMVEPEEVVEPEVIVITGQAQPVVPLPNKGMDKTAVSRQFGPPGVKHPAVGGGSAQQPPITRWDYDGYSVFFEYSHVVDVVQRDNPAPVQVRDGLQGEPTP
ncbi:hypothetical protein [Panacagrimonas sp.]|uniref:hypothetical protein n=1 Tax=Panacagrimonas sp. TaxID=2480088 RepID=UPI003B51887E